jgi:hypothetical protein
MDLFNSEMPLSYRIGQDCELCRWLHEQAGGENGMVRDLHRFVLIGPQALDTLTMQALETLCMQALETLQCKTGIPMLASSKTDERIQFLQPD